MKAKFKNRVSVRTKAELRKYIVIGISLSLFISIGSYIFFYLGNTQNAKAASTVNSVNERRGAWETASLWTGNAVPSTSDDYVINGTITKNGGLSLGNNQSLTISASDTLVIIGDLDIGNKGIVSVSGVLVIRGNYSTQNQSNDVVASGGTLIITGTLSFTGGGADLTANTGSKVYYNPSTNPGIDGFISGGGAELSIFDTNMPPSLVTLMNSAPTISAIANQIVDLSTATGSIAVTIGDAETNTASLTVTAASSNTSLIPNTTASLALGGAAANRTLIITPATDSVGFATITVTVSDGSLSATRTFRIDVGNAWIGTTTNWHTPTNWLIGLPSATRGAYIPTSPSGGNNFPALSADGTAKSIVISTSASVTVNSTYTLNIKDKYLNKGSAYTGNGTVAFNGTSSQTIKGHISKFTLSNSSGLSLNGNVTTNNVITLSSGALNVGSNILTITNPIAGTASNLTTTTSSSIIVSGSASGITLPSSNLNNLTVTNSNGFTMQSDLLVAGTIDLTSGVLNLNGKTLTINGNVNTTSGTISGSDASNLVIGGNEALGTLAFTAGSQTLNNLTINRATANGVKGSMTLGSDLTVKGVLTLTNGIITTGAKMLTVDNAITGAITGYSTNSYINGKLYRRVNSTGSYDLPVGNASNYQAANIKLNSSSGIGYLYATFTSGVTGAMPNFLMGINYVDNVLNSGYWTITPNAVTSANYDVTFTSRGHTNGGVLAEQHTIVKRENSAQSWGSYGTHDASATTGTGSYAITSKRTGITSFSDYAVGLSSAGVLPIQLTEFTGSFEKNIVKLKWTTLTESNNDRFEIERSNDGDKFATIGRIAGSGNSSTKKTYQFSDGNSSGSKIYYRLKQVDTDGQHAYSKLIIVENTQKKNALSVDIFPNPARYDNINLKINSPDISQKAVVSLLNVEGKVLFTEEFDASRLDDAISLRVPLTLSPKTYFINVKQGNTSTIKSLLIVE